ncbi:transposase [Nonomuraea soli]|uniref:transposase n=1 Tax=Nonomuraea soli TaxID=1032476 RepID=UPI0035E40CE1
MADSASGQWDINPRSALSVSGHQGRYAMREIVNALLCQSRTGCQWSLLPHDLPPHSEVLHYYPQMARGRHRPNHLRPAALSGTGEQGDARPIREGGEVDGVPHQGAFAG